MDHKVSKDMISSGMIPSGEKTQADLGRTQYGSAPSPSSLADAYKSIYEHHQKDKDGNTIPHEGEELNEGKIPAGLQAYLDKKKGKKEDKKDMKEENVDEAIITGTALLAGKLAAKALAKKALVGATKMAMKKGTTTAATKLIGKVGAKKAAGMVAKKAAIGTGQSMIKNPVNTMVGASLLKPGPKMNVPMPKDPRAKMTGARTAGVYASADLFDIVKGQLLDEGIDEKDALKIMLELSQQDLDIIVNEGLAGNVARLAAAGTMAAMGVDTINKMRQKKKKMDDGGKFTPGSTMDNIQKKNQALKDAQNM